MLKIPSHFQKRAQAVLKDPAALSQLITASQKKAHSEHKRFASLWEDFKSLFGMLKDYGRGDYRQVPYKSLFSAVMALVYFINPFDLIPDILLFGLIDDALVLGYVISSIKTDLTNYQSWIRARQ